MSTTGKHRIRIGFRLARRWALVLPVVLSAGQPVVACGDDTNPAETSPGSFFGPVTIIWSAQPSPYLSKTVESQLRTRLAGEVRQDRFTVVARQALALFSDEGYRHAAIAPGDFSLTDGALSCVLTIIPGPRTIVHACEFTGTNHTDTSWLRSAAALKSSVPLTRAWLRESRTRLERLSNIEVERAPELIPLGTDSAGQEVVAVRWHLRDARAVRADGLMAAGGAGASTGLTGQASLQFAGLFGRDRSLSISYQHLRAEQSDLGLRVTESSAFGLPLDYGIALNERNRADHRQDAGADLSYGLGQTSWRVVSSGRWQKVAPGSFPVAPSRTVETSVGLASGGDSRWEMDRTENALSGRFALFYSRRRQFADPVSGAAGSATRRLRIDGTIYKAWPVTSSLACRLSAEGRWWQAGDNRLGPGDEWYLGGAERMRGYAEQSLAASSGVWGSLELRQRLGTAAFSVFAESARLDPFPSHQNGLSNSTPYGYGCALWLLSADRTGRLAFAWRDHVSFPDGIVRLMVTQTW